MADIQNVDQDGIQNHMQIDDMLVAIAAIDSEVERYKELKRHRVAPIDKELADLEQRKGQMRDQINEYMTTHNEKSLKYPGLGTVSRRAAKGKWIVVDEDQLLTFLYDKLKGQPLLEQVVKAEPKLVKKELDKVLTGLASVPAEAAVFEQPTTTLAISFEKTDAMLEKTKEARASLSDTLRSTPLDKVVSLTSAFDELTF